MTASLVPSRLKLAIDLLLVLGGFGMALASLMAGQWLGLTPLWVAVWFTAGACACVGGIASMLAAK